MGSGFILDGKQLAAIMCVLCFYMQFYHVCSYFKSVSPISFDDQMFQRGDNSKKGIWFCALTVGLEIMLGQKNIL